MSLQAPDGRTRSLSRRALLGAVCLLALSGLLSQKACADALKITRDVVYGTVEETKLLLDAYQPATDTETRPAIVLIHGGGFIGGDKQFYAPMARHLVEKGYVAFSLNYRLAPKFHYPAQVDDVQRAVRWIRAHADAYHIDPERIGALGDSAGGYLAAMLGTRDTRDNSATELSKYSSRVECVVDLYGPTDFTIPASQAGATANALSLLKMFFGKTQDEAMDLYKDGSPIIYVAKSSAPFLILHGTADKLVPVDQSQRFCDALKAAGVESTLILMHKYPHGFLSPAQPKEAGVLADSFFASHLKPTISLPANATSGNAGESSFHRRVRLDSQGG